MIMALVIIGSCAGNIRNNCSQDIQDARGKMKPWGMRARQTGKYRNDFLEAGYSQKDIDAKLAKAYYDIFEGPGRFSEKELVSRATGTIIAYLY